MAQGLLAGLRQRDGLPPAGLADHRREICELLVAELAQAPGRVSTELSGQRRESFAGQFSARG